MHFILLPRKGKFDLKHRTINNQNREMINWLRNHITNDSVKRKKKKKLNNRNRAELYLLFHIYTSINEEYSKFVKFS